MNLSRNFFIRNAGLAAVLFMACCLVPVSPAQPAERKVPGRYLFIFDTSANMKSRLPALQISLSSMLATAMGGQMHLGDTIGAWTFNQDLYPGDFPLQVWDSGDAANIASDIMRFLNSRKFTSKTHFEALQPLLSQVVKGSERLTVVIFCDGATKITGTTFDTGINKLFEQNAAAQKKAHQPIVVMLRSQLGKYVGCTVSLPPQLVSFPEFPPLPEPPPAPKPAPAPAPVPAPAPPVVQPSMIITGTNVENHLMPQAARPVATNPPPIIEPALAVVAPVVETVVPANESSAPPINPPAPVVEPVAAPPMTSVVPAESSSVVSAASPVLPDNASASALANSRAATPETPVANGKKPFFIGALCLVVAGVVTALIAFYLRRPDRRSLISRSMHDK